MSIILISDSAGSGRIPLPHSSHPVLGIGFTPVYPHIDFCRPAHQMVYGYAIAITTFRRSHPAFKARRDRITLALTAGAGIARAPDTVI